MLEFLKDKKIMIVAAHPDDEILGVGGTINLLVNLGASIKVIILGEGLTSRSEERDPKHYSKMLKIHKKNIVEAKKHLGYHELSTFNLPDNRFDTLPLLEIIKNNRKRKKSYSIQK